MYENIFEEPEEQWVVNMKNRERKALNELGVKLAKEHEERMKAGTDGMREIGLVKVFEPTIGQMKGVIV